MRFTGVGCAALLMVCAGTAMGATPPVVDFETIPAESTPYEGATITDQYWETSGIRFVASAGHRLVLAKVGAPQKAFAGPGGADTPLSGAAVGQYFLTDEMAGAGMTPGPFELEYRYPVQVASGVFMDVDGRETWRAEAFDAAGQRRGEVTIWPTPTQDGSAISWSLDVGSPVITRVQITFIGTASPEGVTFAFDNFAGSGSACTVDLNGDGLVDFGDYLTFLDAFSRGDTVADMNGDGLVDFADYLQFLTDFDAGC